MFPDRFFPESSFRNSLESVASYPSQTYRELCELVNGNRDVELPFVSASTFKKEIKELRTKERRWVYMGCGMVLAVDISQQDLHKLNDQQRDALSFDAGKEVFRCCTHEVSIQTSTLLH